MDTLTVTGFGSRDGDYTCDLRAMLVDVSSPDALTVAEANTIKRLSEARAGELADSFVAGDAAVRMAVALVVLARHDIRVDEADAWAATVGAFRFRMDGAEEDSDAADPPGEGETPSESGGGSGSQTSASPQESDQPPTGHLQSVAS